MPLGKNYFFLRNNEKKIMRKEARKLNKYRLQLIGCNEVCKALISTAY